MWSRDQENSAVKLSANPFTQPISLPDLEEQNPLGGKCALRGLWTFEPMRDYGLHGSTYQGEEQVRTGNGRNTAGHCNTVILMARTEAVRTSKMVNAVEAPAQVAARSSISRNHLDVNHKLIRFSTFSRGSFYRRIENPGPGIYVPGQRS